MEHIGDEIMRGLKAVNRGRGYDTALCKGLFEVAWDLPGFINHEYVQGVGLQLGSIITITGSSIDAQALTCAEYMRQVWPTTGAETLKALQESVYKGIGRSHKCKILLQITIHCDFDGKVHDCGLCNISTKIFEIFSPDSMTKLELALTICDFVHKLLAFCCGCRSEQILFT